MTRVLVFALLVTGLCAAGADKKKAPPTTAPPDWSSPAFTAPPIVPTDPKLDEDAAILVTIRHLNGETESFSKTLDSMDLVFDTTGKLTLVHLILISGTEKDTHRWYSMQNLGYFSYRFLNLAGKGKVRLKMMQAFDKDKEGDQQAGAIPSLTGKDYR